MASMPALISVAASWAPFTASGEANIPRVSGNPVVDRVDEVDEEDEVEVEEDEDDDEDEFEAEEVEEEEDADGATVGVTVKARLVSV